MLERTEEGYGIPENQSNASDQTTIISFLQQLARERIEKQQENIGVRLNFIRNRLRDPKDSLQTLHLLKSLFDNLLIIPEQFDEKIVCDWLV